ncbi:lytic transglycosylase domain-containing protein [Helicobacter pametensis]|uniref:lytic transglycosylase domain-containing protein n=1 Tax=Helicobacter pametensis TaxID=95149 RepID=UPI0004894BA0|nr:lytic transglycosylase domain-containing protein [Helicobacter pametensis]
MKRLLPLLSLVCFLHAQEQITLDFLKSKPKGIARDFYIWQFLQDPKTSLQDSIQAYDLVFRKNDKIEKLVTQKGYIHELPKDLRCKNLSFDKLKEEDAECIGFGLKLSTVPSLAPQEIRHLLKKLSTDDPILAQEVEILSSKDPLNQALKSNNAQVFSEIFYGLNLEQRLHIFNHSINPSQLQALADQNHPNFNKMLQYVLLSDRFSTLQTSILKARITQADERILLLLGVAQLQHHNTTKAQDYFRLTLQKAKSPLIKDKALFWLYLSTQDKSYLQELAKSDTLSIYSIFATQTLGVKPKYSIISQLQELKKGQPKFDISDPFAWQTLRSNLIKIPSGDELKAVLDQHLAYQDSSPHMAVMLTRIKKFKNNYFLMPYANQLTWQDDHQKALTYAVARQESNLLPALVSTSYALGMMQIMPFNLAPIAKSLGKKDMQLSDLFKPQVALEFGRFYLRELEDEFKHPLFVAYAYNGGPGFWRRTLKKKTLFIQGRAYEPWLSLELIPYEESKNYGPLVLANYIIYQELLGNPINLDKLLSQTLVNSKPKKEKQ